MIGLHNRSQRRAQGRVSPVAAILPLIVTFSLVAAACGADSDPSPVERADAIRVGAFNFAESELLAELYAQTLEQQGLPVERLGRIGSREVVEPALELGLIDIVPEYAGTMLSFVSLGQVEPSADSQQTLIALQAALTPRGLVALNPAPAQNRNAIVVTKEFAIDHGVRTLSDLVGLSSDLAFGGPPECPERYFCMVGLADVYGLEFEPFIAIPNASVVVASLRANEIDVGLLFSTDPLLVESDLVVLNDDLGLQPAENVVPVIRAATLDQYGPEVVDVLNAVSHRLDGVDLVQLNAQAQDQHLALATIVADWLAASERPDRTGISLRVADRAALDHP